MDFLQELDVDFTQNLQILIDEGKTYEQISQILRSANVSVTRGLSARSVRRFCADNGITKKKGADLDQLVAQSVSEVGNSYGRIMMKGHLEAKGFKIAESRIGSSLQRVCPSGHSARRTNSVNRLNPIRYSANYFGHKLHIDQNEKLICFGVTHVVARDGYSGKIVGFLTLPVKNNVAIYDGVYRSAVETYGLWDQLRIDHGREFYLCMYIQEHIRGTYGSQALSPYVQSRSKENLTIERIWPEVNHRVNYPIKLKLIEMEAQNYIDMTSPTIKFCVSFVCVNVAYHGLSVFVEAWNCHPITSGGTPNTKATERLGTTHIQPGVLPTGDQARQRYEMQGGNITQFGEFGVDPLRNRPDLVLRRDGLFAEQSPAFSIMFSNVVSGSCVYLRDGILNFISITRLLEQLI